MDTRNLEHVIMKVEIPGEGMKLLPIDPLFVRGGSPMLVRKGGNLYVPTRDPKEGISLQKVQIALYKYQYKLNPYTYDKLTFNRMKNLTIRQMNTEFVTAVFVDEKAVAGMVTGNYLESVRVAKHVEDSSSSNVGSAGASRSTIVRSKPHERSNKSVKGENNMSNPNSEFSIMGVIESILGPERIAKLRDGRALEQLKEAVADKLGKIDMKLAAGGAAAAVALVVVLDFVRDWGVYLIAQKRVGDQTADNIRTFKRAGVDIRGVESPKLATIKSLQAKFGVNSSVANINHNGNMFLKSTYHIDQMIRDLGRREREIVLEYFDYAVKALVEKGYNAEVFKVLAASTPLEGEIIDIEPRRIEMLEKVMDFVEIDSFYPPLRLSLADLYSLVAAAERG